MTDFVTRGEGTRTRLLLPLLDLGETLAELAAVQHDLDLIDDRAAVCPERREELRATRQRWRDRLQQQACHLKGAA